jgi:hypothetical protein
MHGTYRIDPGGTEESVTRLEALAKLMTALSAFPAPTSASGSTR